MQNGSVSFFPRLEQCRNIKIPVENGGEWLGFEVRALLKSIARMYKIKYCDLPHKDNILKSYCDIGSNIVILYFSTPIDLLSNYSNKLYRDGYEIYSHEKVSMEYLKGVINI